MYKSSDRAVKAIQNGEHFKDNKFNLLRDDYVVALEAIEHHDLNCQFISERLKDDKGFCLLAVTNGRAIEHISERLRADREVVKKAVSHNAQNLLYASKELRDDVELVYIACKLNAKAIVFASERWKELCADTDPVKYLESQILAQDLQKNLIINRSSKPTKRLKV